MAAEPIIIARVRHAWLLLVPLAIQETWPSAWMDRLIVGLLRRLTVIEVR